MSSAVTNASWSIYYRLMLLLQQAGWTVQGLSVPLQPAKEDGLPPLTYEPANPNFQRQWIYMDGSGNPWPSGVLVKQDGVPLDSSDYQVDYTNSLITLASPPSGVLTADLLCLGVLVDKGFHEWAGLTDRQLPIVTFDMDSHSETPFAVGSSQGFQHRHFTVDVLAHNDIEVQDIDDDICKGIRFLPIFDFTQHQYLDEFGHLDPGFDMLDQFICRANFMNGRPRATLLDPNDALTEKERHHAVITFTCNLVE